MTGEGKESTPPPSTLPEMPAPSSPESPLFSRMAVMKKLAESRKLEIPKHLQDDQHFWYLVAREYWGERKTTIKTAKILDTKIQRTEEQLGKIRELAIKNAIQKAGQVFGLEKEVAIDHLTGAFNRRTLDRYLLQLFSRAHPQTIHTIIMFDIDRFKHFNDRYGHPVGDIVLKELIKMVTENIRSTDFLARFGGEEFMLVLPDRERKTGGESEEKFQEEILRRLEEMRRTIAEKLKDQVNALTEKQIIEEITASFGVLFVAGDTVITTEEELKNKIYQPVDQYLYRAKKQGRNTVFDAQGRYPRE